MPVDLKQIVEVLAPVAREADRRAFRQTPIEVLDYHPSKPDDPKGHLALRGTITVYLVREGDAKLAERIRVAASAKDSTDIELTAELRKRAEGRKRLDIRAAAKLVLEQPVLAEVRYGGSALALNYFVPDSAGYCAAVLPYNGGRLDASKLELVERFKDEDLCNGYRAIGLRHPPKLTPAEQAALTLLPDSQLSISIGPVALCFALSAIAAAALVTLVIICAAALPLFDKVDKAANLADDEVRKLGPSATARQLLLLRRRLVDDSVEC